jgi:serralysin
MSVLSQNSLSNETILNNAMIDGTSFSETIDIYLDVKNLLAIPTYNGGAGWNEYEIFGLGGNDKIVASHGDDNIYGGSGNDSIRSWYGYNYIEGGTGSDTLDYSWYGQRTSLNNDLGVRADLATGNTQTREIISGMRFDDEFISIENLKGSSFNDVLRGNSVNNTIDGGYGNDAISGFSGNDKLFGGQNNDSLSGGNGDDLLFGGSGNDTLIGGIGADDLTGGTGADRFRFTSAADSTSDLLSQDLITDFVRSEGDVIDLSALTSVVIDFINTSAFSGDGTLVPEVRYFHDGNSTVVQVDTNGNAITNIEFTMTGVYTLNEFDFIL